MTNYKYKLDSTEGNSNSYGNCDICGKHCTEVFIQTEERAYSFEHDGKTYSGLTQNKCHNHFGHKTCLESVRR